MRENYFAYIEQRGAIRFILGLVPRFRTYIKHRISRRIAIKRGATIGEGSVICRALAKKANKNLVIGKHCCISTADIDLRALVTIGDYVMLSKAVRILNASHNIHSENFETLYYPLKIENYCWLVGCLITPRVGEIGFGAVCGVGAVVVRDVKPMSVVGGNPAQVISKRKVVHNSYLPEILNGGDLEIYIKTWLGHRKRNKNE